MYSSWYITGQKTQIYTVNVGEMERGVRRIDVLKAESGITELRGLLQEISVFWSDEFN